MELLLKKKQQQEKPLYQVARVTVQWIGRSLALQTADLGSIPDTPLIPLSTARVIPKQRIRQD